MLVTLICTGPICATNVRVHCKVHIPKFRGYNTRISWPARTPAGPTSCPASTAATKTKNRNWNQWEQEPPTSGGDMSVDHSKRKSAREKERERNTRRWNRIQRNAFDTRCSVYHPFPNVSCQKKILRTFQRRILKKNVNYKFIGYHWLKFYRQISCLVFFYHNFIVF